MRFNRLRCRGCSGVCKGFILVAALSSPFGSSAATPFDVAQNRLFDVALDRSDAATTIAINPPSSVVASVVGADAGRPHSQVRIFRGHPSTNSGRVGRSYNKPELPRNFVLFCTRLCCGGGRWPPSPSALGSSAAIGRSYNKSGTIL